MKCKNVIDEIKYQMHKRASSSMTTEVANKLRDEIVMQMWARVRGQVRSRIYNKIVMEAGYRPIL
jgi:hypothetical protein